MDVERLLPELLPYDETEFHEGMARVIGSPRLPHVLSTGFPKAAFDDLIAICRGMKGVDEFQKRIIVVAIESFLKRTSCGLTFSGWERLSPARRYTYFSNHRDIICDPALLCVALLDNGFRTPKILLGDNLLTDPFVVDLVKMNKGVTVKRDLATRELLQWSHVLSRLVSREIHSGIDSVWIAQREGRAKDGNDETHPGVLKMLTLSGQGDLLTRLEALHLVPMAVSYEYDPCDALKARELYLTVSEGSYRKSAGEDAESMALGIQGFKGGIHIALGEPLDPFLADLRRRGGTWRPNDLLLTVARELDRRIRLEYRNWPSNFIAFDLLEGTATMRGHYDEPKKTEFLERLQRQLDTYARTPAERAGMRDVLLSSYANPVRNFLKTK